MVVLHYTAMDSAERARDWLCAEEAQVSAHYVIAPDGRLWQLVAERDRAWHAGVGRWGAVCDVNSHSIGIEICNTGDQPFAAPQMDVVERLLAGIMARWGIGPARVVGHSDTALARKIDPGRRFDWKRLARGGLAVWPEPRVPGQGQGGVAGVVRDGLRDATSDAVPDAPYGDMQRGFMADAVRFGYDPQGDVGDVLAAFRMRFRPWATGVLDAQDADLMADLAARWPVADQGAGQNSGQNAGQGTGQNTGQG